MIIRDPCGKRITSSWRLRINAYKEHEHKINEDADLESS